MTGPEPGEVTRLLEEARGGSREATDRVLPLVYAELRRIAARQLGRERRGHTLQATGLVNEAYLRLIRDASLSFESRSHFLGIAARAMRQILVEHARSRGAAKRGGDPLRVTLDESLASGHQMSEDVIALDEALTRLASLDAQQAGVVELRFFGGLSIEETAAALQISPATVKRDWTVARAWLFRELASLEPPR